MIDDFISADGCIQYLNPRYLVMDQSYCMQNVAINDSILSCPGPVIKSIELRMTPYCLVITLCLILSMHDCTVYLTQRHAAYGSL
jgi:hypothetical protein